MAIASRAAPLAPSPEPPATAPAPLADDTRGGWTMAALFAFALVIGAYFTFRYGGTWAETDTASQAAAIRSVVAEAKLLPEAGNYYPSGYGFAAVSAFLLTFTGAGVDTLLQRVYPLISASLVFIAWPVYRELTGSARAATLSTVILFVQPEFLFVILRGSHERVLRALLLIALWLLVRSIRRAEHTSQYTATVLLFNAAAFGVIATNSFFGSSFVWALGVALAGSWFGGYLGPGLRQVSMATHRRLIYVPLFCFVLAFLFNEYIYPPAGRVLGNLGSIADRLYQILLTTSPEGRPSTVTAYDPYAAVFEQWIDVRVYFLLSLGTYLLIAASAFFWGRTGLRWLARSGEPPTLGQWMLWLLYGAFALQGALSVFADIGGVLGGNLQYRSFPSFIMIAAPMLASELVRVPLRSKLLRALAAAALGVFALLAVLKATNEPSVSNKWTFYSPAEVGALRFAASYLQDHGYWSDFDERLGAVQVLLNTSSVNNYISPNTPGLRAFIVSDIVRLRSARLTRPLPPVLGELRVYDNGEVQIYRRRAETPFQR